MAATTIQTHSETKNKTTSHKNCCWCQSAKNSCSMYLQNAWCNVPWVPYPAINRRDPPALFRVQLGHHLRSHSASEIVMLSCVNVPYVRCHFPIWHLRKGTLTQWRPGVKLLRCYSHDPCYSTPTILHLATRSAEEVKGHLLSPSPQCALCRCFLL